MFILDAFDWIDRVLWLLRLFRCQDLPTGGLAIISPPTADFDHSVDQQLGYFCVETALPSMFDRHTLLAINVLPELAQVPYISPPR